MDDKKVEMVVRERQHCKCKRSRCLLKYCVCFKDGVKCDDECQCVKDCMNNGKHRVAEVPSEPKSKKRKKDAIERLWSENLEDIPANINMKKKKEEIDHSWSEDLKDLEDVLQFVPGPVRRHTDT